MKKMPRYTYDEKDGHGTLTERFGPYPTRITNTPVDTQYIVLDAAGLLDIRAGFHWDFGSGPAVDDPPMVVASLYHDALCILIELGYLGWEHRKRADRIFRSVLKDYGANPFRRMYCYVAVRLHSIRKGLDYGRPLAELL